MESAIKNSSQKLEDSSDKVGKERELKIKDLRYPISNLIRKYVQFVKIG